MVTPLIQFAIDFNKGKISSFDFADKYLDMWDDNSKDIGRNDKDTWEVAAKIRTACDDYFPHGHDIDEFEFRKLIKKYLTEI